MNDYCKEEWIPVIERMPRPDYPVLCLTKDGTQFVGMAREGKWWSDTNNFVLPTVRLQMIMTKRVTHWMYLPVKPKDKR